MLVNADLHIHSRFSGGTSYKMNLKNLSEGAKLKGIQILATGDCLHPMWIDEIKSVSDNNGEEGIFDINGVKFVLSTEVEDRKRVHHLILFPSLYAVDGFREEVMKH